MLDSCYFCFFKQKTAYEMRISDWSSDVCSSDLAEDVPAEYARLMLVEMGFEPDAAPTLDHGRAGDADVLIVGAGVSGLALAVRLDQAGLRYTIVDKDDNVSGTWLENRYTGAGADTPSYLYPYRTSAGSGKSE